MNAPLRRLAVALVLGLVTPSLHAQETLLDQARAATDTVPDGWQIGAGLGLDLGQLLNVNPRVGGGENRIGIGTNVTIFADLERGLHHWSNNATLNFAVQKLGQGVLPRPFQGRRVPFQKSIDELRLASQYGREFGEDVPWGYGVEATFLTQLAPTYQDSAGRNLLSNVDDNNQGSPIAEFLSPATFTLSPGITYRPNDYFDALFSPASYKTVFVANEDIADVRTPSGDLLYAYLGRDDGSATSLQQFGASLRANYGKTFLADERLLVKSTLGLFSNYLDNPQNIDIDWRNEIGFEVTKGLTVSLNTVLLYDDDVPVQISDFDGVGGFERNPDGSVRLGRRPTFTEQLLIKYSLVF